MRAREFLVEYDRQKTADNIGSGIILGLAKDESLVLPPLAAEILAKLARHLGVKPASLRNAAFLDDSIKYSIPAALQKELVNDILSVIETKDPTPNKEYTQWLARMYAKSKGGVRMEDLNRLNLIGLYHVAKKRRLLKPEDSDINRFKWYSDFEDRMESEYDFFQDLETESLPEGKANKVYEDDQVLVVVPLDKAAACRYGRGTRWCTAATRGENYFDQYNHDGPLYILIPKHPAYKNEKYQLHFATEQYMDDSDDPISIGWLLLERFNDQRLTDYFLGISKVLRKYLVFTDDEFISKTMNDIKPLCAAHMDKHIVREMNLDEDYKEALRRLGYANHYYRDRIDFEKARREGHGYLQYDSKLRDAVDDIKRLFNMSPQELKKTLSDPSIFDRMSAGEGEYTWTNLPSALGDILLSPNYYKNPTYTRGPGGSLVKSAPWLGLLVGEFLLDQVYLNRLTHKITTVNDFPRANDTSSIIDLEENWKKTLGAAGMAGMLALGTPSMLNKNQQNIPYNTPAATQTINKDLDILAKTIWGEARGHGAQGMLAVGNVIKNRAEDTRHAKLFGKGIRGVALKPKQFSVWNKGDPNQERLKKILALERHIKNKQSPTNEPFDVWFKKTKNTGLYLDYQEWVKAKQIAKKIVDGNAPDITNGAKYYHTTEVNPSWANNSKPIAKVGNHVFYSSLGALNEYKVDNINGLGSTPVNANVNYRGLRVLMRPSVFLKLAYPLTKDRSVDYIVQHMQQGGSLGSPFLNIDIPDEYFQGDFSKSASVDGHEGRNRMKAIMKLEGDEPVEVHIFPVGEIRARHLTKNVVQQLQRGIRNQENTRLIHSHGNEPLFTLINT